VDLGEHAPAGRGRLVEQGQIRAPDIGHAAPAEHSEGHRPARLHSEVAQPHVILAQTRVPGRAVDTLAGQLEDARIEIAHHADEATYLFPRRGAAGHGPPTGGFVRRRARGSEAHRPSTYGIAHVALHRLEVVLRRLLLERALAHHVRAHGRVADV